MSENKKELHVISLNVANDYNQILVTNAIKQNITNKNEQNSIKLMCHQHHVDMLTTENKKALVTTLGITVNNNTWLPNIESEQLQQYKENFVVNTFLQLADLAKKNPNCKIKVDMYLSTEEFEAISPVSMETYICKNISLTVHNSETKSSLTQNGTKPVPSESEDIFVLIPEELKTTSNDNKIEQVNYNVNVDETTPLINQDNSNSINNGNDNVANKESSFPWAGIGISLYVVTALIVTPIIAAVGAAFFTASLITLAAVAGIVFTGGIVGLIAAKVVMNLKECYTTDGIPGANGDDFEEKSFEGDSSSTSINNDRNRSFKGNTVILPTETQTPDSSPTNNQNNHSNPTGSFKQQGNNTGTEASSFNNNADNSGNSTPPPNGNGI